MSIEALTWPSGAEVFADAPIGTDADAGRSIVSRREDIEGAARAIEADIVDLFDEEQPDGEERSDTGREPLRLSKWDLDTDRFEVWNNMQRNRRAVWRWLVHGKGRKYARAFGLVLDDPDPAKPQQTIYRNDWGDPSVEVHSVRTALRRDSRGAIQTDLVIEVTQRRRGYFEPDEQDSADRGPAFDPEQDGDFKFRAGCTIVIDTTRNAFRHVIQTPGTVADDDELGAGAGVPHPGRRCRCERLRRLRTRSLRSAPRWRLERAVRAAPSSWGGLSDGTQAGSGRSHAGAEIRRHRAHVPARATATVFCSPFAARTTSRSTC